MSVCSQDTVWRRSAEVNGDFVADLWLLRLPCCVRYKVPVVKFQCVFPMGSDRLSWACGLSALFLEVNAANKQGCKVAADDGAHGQAGMC